MANRARLILGFLVGGLIGVCVVRILFLDEIEKIAFGMFWEGLGHGQMMNLGVVLRSATFAKCCGGFIIVGLIAAFVTASINNKRQVAN